MYEFHYDYMKPKYGGNLKLCYMDTDSFTNPIKTEDSYADIASDVELRVNMSGHSKKDARPLPIGLNRKVIGLMKDESGGKIMTEFLALRPKLYVSKLSSKEDKPCKRIEKCVITRNACSMQRVKVSIGCSCCLGARSMKSIQSKLTRLP